METEVTLLMNRKWTKTIIFFIISIALVVETLPISMMNGQVYAQEKSSVSENTGENSAISGNEMDADKTDSAEENTAVGETDIEEEVNNEESENMGENPAISGNEDNNIEETPVISENDVNEEKFTGNENETGTDESISENDNDKSNDISASEEFRIEGFERESEKLVYNGKQITQNILIYHNDILLKENVDYILSYKNNVEAAPYDSENAPSVTIIMQGQYTGSHTLYFTILPGEVEEETVIPDRNMKDVVLGEMWQENITFSQNKLDENGGIYQSKTGILKFVEGDEAEELVEETDYTVKYINADKAGTVIVVFRGIGRYEGILWKTYSILPNKELTVRWLNQDANGNPIVPYQKDGAMPQFELTDNDGNVLSIRKDYTVRLKNNREVGMMKCEIIGRENYEGYKFSSEVQVVPADIGQATMIAEDRKYSGKPDAWKAPVEIRDVNGRPLLAGKDYEKELVYYYEGMEDTPIPTVGTEIFVTAQGKNNYANSYLTGSYDICKWDLNDLIIDIDAKIYTGHEIELESSDIHVYADKESRKKGIEITENCYEIVEYQRNTRVGIASVTLRGVGEYGGTRTCFFFINKKKFEIITIPVTYFELNTSSVEGYAGSTYQLEVLQVQPENADTGNAVWKSSDANVASVNPEGMISLNAPGMAVITVSFEDSECVRKCAVWVKKEAVDGTQGNYLTPQMFKESDDVDDTDSFNKAIENLEEYGFDTVYVPEGTYTIDAEKGIQLKSNMNLIMSPDAILQAVPNSSQGYNIITLNNISNTTISGGQIIGEREQHESSGGEWGMGIGLYDSRNIMISDVKISDCWGDGIYLGTYHDDLMEMGCKDITIINCTMDNNRRNNLSIVSGEYVTIDGCTFTNANGTDPQYGIDIETNNSENPCRHIVISNSEFSGNFKGSVGIMTTADDVTISNCSLKGDFFNYAGTNVVLSNTQIYGEAYARIGISMLNGSKINTGSEAEDVLIASFDAGTDQITLGAYNLNSSNKMMQSYMDSSLSPSGKVLRLERTSQGTGEAGYYFNLADLTLGGEPVLEAGCNYRYEYVIRGYGEWGIDTDQNGWYPCVGQTERFTTGITCYVADDDVENCRLIIFAKDMTKGMCLEIDSIKIYKVN